MKKIIYTAILSVLCIAGLRAQIYSYTNNTAGTYASVAANATGTALTRVNGATVPGSACGSGFSSTSFSSATIYATTLAAVEADVTPAAGYILSVTDFSVGLRRSGTGPASVRLAYSTDGGTTWIDKGTNDAPNSGSCGNTATVTWTSAFTVPSGSTLMFRVYGFNASGTSGTCQVLNLLINGAVVTSDSIFTGAASFGPFCAGLPDTISVPFTQTGGGFSSLFQVQLSDPSGIFPNDATSNIISAGSATSPVQAVIPDVTPWANGYRVRVVNQSPTFYSSGDNGSNIVIMQSVTPSFSILPLSSTTICAGTDLRFTSASVTNGGANPVITWYVNGDSSASGSLYSSTMLHNNDTISATLTSDATCAVPATVSSSDLVVTVYPTATTTLYDTICPGASVTFGTRTLTAGGTYLDTLTTVHSCDSIVTLYLVVKTLHTAAVTAAVCQGDSYVWNGQTYTTSGAYSDTIRCDSIVTLTLTYRTVSTVIIPASICAGGSYTWHGQSYTAAASYSDTVRCDSIVTLVLTVNALPAVSWNPADTFICTNYARFTVLSGATPAGGVYSGNYVSSDTLYHGTSNSVYHFTEWIRYTYTDNNQCGNADSAYFSGDICGGISTIDISNSISVYPNPTENKIHIDATDLSGTSTVTLTDLTGRVIYTTDVSGAAIHTGIDLSGYEKGIYLLSLRNGNSTGTRQVVKY